MGIYETTGTLSHQPDSIPSALAFAVLGLALLIGILHETTFALEVLQMLVARVKEHLRKLFAAARGLWAELTTWEPTADHASSERRDDAGG